MTEHIKQTRYPELGLANCGRACWRIVDRSTNQVVGPIYGTKAELLADLDRYAAVFGSTPMSTHPYDERYNGQPLSSLDHCAAKPKARRLTIIATSPSDRNLRFSVPTQLAWTIAQAIAAKTHYACVLHGVYGMARFRIDGSGFVEWNSNSTMPGRTTEFGERTTVCVW